MVVVQGRLTTEVGAALRRALEAACDHAQAQRAAAEESGSLDYEASDVAAAEEALAPTFAQRQADAVGVVAECALAGGLDRGTAGDRYQVVLHVDAGALADARDVPAGTSVPGSASAPQSQTVLGGDSPAAGLRCGEGRDAARSGRRDSERWPPHADHLTGAAVGAGGARRAVPVPGLSEPPLRCTSRAALG